MEEQEINLYDYINVIIKRKRIILTVFLISVITTAVISSFMPKVYEATAIIQNGNINGLLIAKAEVEEIIKSQDLLLLAIKKSKVDITDITSLRKAIEVENIEKTAFFRLIVKYKGADVPIKICQAIIDSYFAFAKPICQKRINLLDNQIEELDNQLKDVKNNMQSLQKIISSFSLPEESKEVMSEIRFIFLRETLSNYGNRLSFLTKERDKLNLVRINAKEFKVIDAPLRQKNPIKPKKRQHVIISGIIGLMFGIFLAFFMEYWDKSSKQN